MLILTAFHSSIYADNALSRMVLTDITLRMRLESHIKMRECKSPFPYHHIGFILVLVLKPKARIVVVGICTDDVQRNYSNSYS